MELTYLESSVSKNGADGLKVVERTLMMMMMMMMMRMMMRMMMMMMIGEVITAYQMRLRIKQSGKMISEKPTAYNSTAIRYVGGFLCKVFIAGCECGRRICTSTEFVNSCENGTNVSVC